MNILHLKTSSWCQALRDTRSVCRVDLRGLSGRFPTPAGWDSGVRRLPEHLVYYFSEHGARAEIDGIFSRCPPGSCCWIYPGTRFRFFAGDAPPPLLYRFRFSVRRNHRGLAPAGRFIRMEEAGGAFPTIQHLLREGTRKDEWSDERVRALLALFSLELFSSRKKDRRRGPLTPAQQESLREFMDTRPAGPGSSPSPHDLARVVGLSPDYFTRNFRRTYGISPRSWLLRQRLRHAAVLLDESTLRIGEVAERLGYKNLYLFSRQFRAFHGLSPRAWRQRE